MLIAWHGVTSTPAPLYPNKTEHILSPIFENSPRLIPFSDSSCTHLWFLILYPFKSQFFIKPIILTLHCGFAIHFHYFLLYPSSAFLFVFVERGTHRLCSSFALLHFFFLQCRRGSIPSVSSCFPRYHELYTSSSIFVFGIFLSFNASVSFRNDLGSSLHS